MKVSPEFSKQMLGVQFINSTNRILAEADRRRKSGKNSQQNAKKLAALLKPKTEGERRREQLNRALSK